MKIFSTILLLIAGAFIWNAVAKEQPCTDDGCKEFTEQVELITYQEIEDFPNVLPAINTDTKSQFVYTLSKCIDKIYETTDISKQIPKELIIAQAALETGWGKSRFANEGNNLFGIRTWDKDEPYLLPIPWTKWPGWGVKMYSSKCESVVDYLHIINNVHAFEELREARANGVNDALELANYLEKYASKPTYVELVKEIIKYNIRGVYEL